MLFVHIFTYYITSSFYQRVESENYGGYIFTVWPQVKFCSPEKLAYDQYCHVRPTLVICIQRPVHCFNTILGNGQFLIAVPKRNCPLYHKQFNEILSSGIGCFLCSVLFRHVKIGIVGMWCLVRINFSRNYACMISSLQYCLHAFHFSVGWT